MISVDALNGDFSFIKADVEGSEVQMIKGAENTILRCRPKMQIACYHRTGDLTDIPQAVWSGIPITLRYWHLSLTVVCRNSKLRMLGWEAIR